MKRICLSLAFALAACGGATPAANNAETAPASTAAPAPPKAAEPESKSAPASTNEAVAAPAPPKAEEEAAAEKCDSGWICVKVSFDTKKVEPRPTKLIGDPKIDQTWSKNTDGRPATFDAFPKGPLEVTLRRKPGNKNEIVAKLGKGSEVVVDRRDGTVDDFTYVSAIVAEQGGALLVDLHYMK
ncbi:MAG: hypothetical protein K0S65_5035 [Labilithrix sp.]|nr:hypothetical protein [Labilithrix sp.]